MRDSAAKYTGFFLMFLGAIFTGGCSNSFPENDSMLLAAGAALAESSGSNGTDYSLGGNLQGLLSGGILVLKESAGEKLTLDQNGSFAFLTRLADATAYSVSVHTQPTGQSCSLSGEAGSIAAADVSSIAVNCQKNTFSLGGSISGLSGSLTLQNNGADDLSVSSASSFTMPTAVSYGDSYSLTVSSQPTGQTCVVSGGSGTVGSSGVSGVSISCTTNSYQVGGSVSGLSGTLKLQLNSSETVTITTNSSYQFTTGVTYGSTYSISVLSQPSAQSCTVSPSSGTMGTSSVSNLNVTCSTATYTVGGTVSGLTGTVVLQNNGGDDLSISADGGFTFATGIAVGATYSVTVLTQPTGQTCTVSPSGSQTMGSSNVTGMTVTCSSTAYTIGGTMTGLVGTAVLQLNGGSDLVVSADGSFTFSTGIINGGSYTATLLSTPSTQICSLGSATGTVAAANVSSITVNCSDSYSIGGSVSGLSGTVGLTLSGGASEVFSVGASGGFSFSNRIVSTGSYTVTVSTQPATGSCSVSSGGTGTVAAANITDVVVTCTTTGYVVGGTVTGLTGTLILQNNGADDLVVSSGSFNFATQLANGAAYSVTVLADPVNQTCSVSSGTGTVPGANVTTVSVTCTSNYTINGSVTGLSSGTLGLSLSGAHTDSVSVTANGAFGFTSKFVNGEAYTVSVGTQPSGQTCTVTNGSGTVSTQDVLNVTVSCVSSTPTYTIGGTVTGLTGTLVLQNNGGDDLVIGASGSFTFSTSIPDTNAYAVTKVADPSGQTCSISSGSGSVSGANVTSVSVTCLTLYTISASLSGISGTVNLQLDKNASSVETPTGLGNTSYTFTTTFVNGDTYAVSVTSISGDQTCSVTGGGSGTGSGTIASASVTSILVTCSTNTYAIGGTVTGLSGTLVLQNNGADDKTISANGAYTFGIAMASGAAYNVTVLSQPTGQTCTVDDGDGNGTGTMPASAFSSVNVSCANNSYTIGGVVTGLSGSVDVQVDGAGTTTWSANGGVTFSSSYAFGGTYAVTVSTQPTGQTCSFNTGTVTLNTGSNYTGLTLTCVHTPYNIKASVSGLAGTVSLLNNGTDSLSPSADGTYTFGTQIPHDQAYNVTVQTQPSGQTCVVSSPSGIVGTADVTVTVTCASTTYSLSGILTGASGSVTLQLNGGSDIVMGGNGVFSWSPGLVDSTAYAVTVSSAPATQTCTVTGGGAGDGTGSISTAVVSNLLVSCATTTYSIGGTITNFTGGTLTIGDSSTGHYENFTGPLATYTLSYQYSSGQSYNLVVPGNPTGYSCSVSGGGPGTISGNVSTANITCAVATYSVSFQVVGLSSGTVTVGLDADNDATVDETLGVSSNTTSTFTAQVTHGNTFNVTIDTQPGGGQTCSVVNGTASPTASVSNVVVDCNGSGATLYTVGGSITGLNGTISLKNVSNSEILAVMATGAATTYTMPTDLADTTAYDIDITNPTGQTCVFDSANDAGTIASASVSNINITCTSTNYTVGATLVGYGAGAVQLINNGTDTLTYSANGFQSFTPGTSYKHGDSYNVTINSVPATQTCTVYNGTGVIMGGANIADIIVVCEDPAEVIVDATGALSTHEDAASPSASFSMRLAVEPTADVTVTLVTQSGYEDEVDFSVAAQGIGATDSGTVTFKPTSTCTSGVNCWNESLTVTVAGADDSVQDGNQTFAIQTGAAASTDSRFSGLAVSDVTITNVDNDIAGITVNVGDGLIVTEGATSDTFTVVLNAEPLASVTIPTITSGDTGEVTVTPNTLTFTTGNWNVPQTVTVTGVDDIISDGYQSTQIVLGALTAGDGGAYAVGLDPDDVTVFTVDDEPAVPGVTIIADPVANVTEGLGSYVVWVVLASPPTDTVTVPFTTSGANPAEATILTASPLTFLPANWNVPQKVEIEAVNDTTMDGDLSLQILFGDITGGTDTGYDALTTETQDVLAINNDKYIFTTTSAIIPDMSQGTGTTAVDKADTICNDPTYGYPGTGTYKALIGHSTLRKPYPLPVDWPFKPNATYYRSSDNAEVMTTNGVGVFDFSAATLTNATDATAAVFIWTGLYYDFTVDSTYNCTDWTSSSASKSGWQGVSSYTDSYSISYNYYACNDTTTYMLCVAQ